MKVSAAIWLVFALCLLLVLAAMGWLSATALRLDRQAAVEERVRLALWRMDSDLAPFVAQESARPYFTYLAYFPADRAFSRMFNTKTKGETLIASPLLLETPPRILLHFQFDAAGNLTSPQLPQGANRKLDSSLDLDAEIQNHRETQFSRLREIITLEKITTLLHKRKLEEIQEKTRYAESSNRKSGVQRDIANATESIGVNDEVNAKIMPPESPGMQPGGNMPPSTTPSPSAKISQEPAKPQEVADKSDAEKPGNADRQPQGNFYGGQPGYVPGPQQSASMPQQMLQSQREYDQRAQAVKNSADLMAMNQMANLPLSSLEKKSHADASPPASTDINGVLMTPLWIDGELVLARRVTVAGQEYVQGCLLDWPKIRDSLKSEIADLLPDADLAPATFSDTAEKFRLLAALPIIRLVPGAVAAEGEAGWSPLTLSLLAAWVCLFITAAAIVGLLWGVMRLSARRASFVTAVTHELRTPLTTFQMYTEMLAENMVPEESRQKQYLNTLRAEAVRLTHLVENVLSYARLERGRMDRRLQITSLGELVGSMQNRLADRASQAGMEIVVESDENNGGILVKTNISAVEQILFNLVDNACKYAAAAADKRIRLLLQEDGGNAMVGVEDHGPGIDPEMRRRLFHSFSKTAKEAAHSAPGVGLGLALSRRLARDLGGDLSFEGSRHSPGACFVLALPLA